MSDILHRIGATASPEDTYAALATIDGLSGWWTEDTSGDPTPGGVIRFRFNGPPEPGGFDMKVLESTPGTLVLWEVVEGPPEWIGTTIRFEISQADGYTIVLFRHEGWAEPVDFMHHCSTKWATFLLSMKEMLETGAGRPDPHDVRISDWH